MSASPDNVAKSKFKENSPGLKIAPQWLPARDSPTHAD
jgi:hypothetical protein